VHPVLEPADWDRLLASVPRHCRNLRPPAPESSLREVESNLGRSLPRGFRNFLCTGDGGFLGACQILGTCELKRPWPTDLPEGLVPFHPLGAGFECLDLRSEDRSAWIEAIVVWWAPGRRPEPTYNDFTDWALDQIQDVVDA
jgi:hypothetical protein